MAAKFHKRRIELSSGKIVEARFYIADPMDFRIEPTSSSSAQKWADDKEYGTNGSFYVRQKTGRDVGCTALHIYKNKNMSEYDGHASGGNDNLAIQGNLKSGMDAIYCNGDTKKPGRLSKIVYWSKSASSNHGVSNMQWGIGGFNLFPQTQYKNESDFSNAFQNYYMPSIYDLNLETSRTAIGYRSDNKIVLVAAFGKNVNTDYGPKVWDMHLLMKYFGCTDAILLDGGTVTKVSYRENNTDKAVDTSRLTAAKIYLLRKAANTCDWTGN